MENIDYKLVFVNGQWYAAFKDKFYHDYVIEFGFSSPSKEDVIKAVEDSFVYAGMSEKGDVRENSN